MAQNDPKEANNNVDDSESIASDESEEMIEVDEDEFDRWRAIYVAEMKELELQFAKLKEELINEKQVLVDQKLKEIEDETAEEFTGQLQKLKNNMDTKIRLATLMKEYRLKNIENDYLCEQMSIKQSLENDKALLHEKQISRLENEIKQLKEKRRQFLLDYNYYQLNNTGYIENECEDANNLLNNERPNPVDSTQPTLTSIKDEPIKSKRINGKKTTTRSPTTIINNNNCCANLSPCALPGAPFIVYSLQDYDILEDWSIIKMHSNS